MSPLAYLPNRVAGKSISSREIVLPLAEALEAINLLESRGLLILGWEGWIKTADGRVGHGSAPQGTTSLAGLPVSEAADWCRRTIREEAATWTSEHPGTTDKLYFCLTVQEA